MPNLLALIPGADWKHPNPRLQQAWNFARMGFLIFPALPAIGVFPIFFALVLTWKNATAKILAHRVNWLLAIWSVWSIGVSLFGVEPGDALLGLANLLPYFAFFAAYSILIQTTDQLRQLAWILLLSAIPVMLLGFAELWLHWGGDLAIGGTPIQIVGLHPGGNPPGRMASLLGYATGLAEYLQMAFVLALGLWVDAWEQRGADSAGTSVRRRAIDFWRSPKIIYLTGFLAICGTALLLTSSRAAWGGAIVSLSIFALYQAWYWWLGLVAAALAIVLSAAYAPSPLKAPLRAIVPRYLWARITDEMYPDRPEALTRVSQFKLYQAHSHTWVPQPHNIVLMLSSSLGLPATIGLIAIVGWIVARGTILFLDFPIEWRSSRTIFFTFLIAFGGFIMFNMTDVTLPDLRLNALAWLLLASICGLYYQSQPSPRSRVTE
jgi:O-antigen ligase